MQNVYFLALVGSALTAVVGARPAEHSHLIQFDQINWQGMPNIPPPENDTALFAARAAIREAFKGTVIELLFTNSTAVGSAVGSAGLASVGGASVAGDVTPQEYIQCESSDGSPIVEDVYGAGVWLQSNRKGYGCGQGDNDHCTEMVRWGTAGASMCAWPKHRVIDCYDAGDHIYRIGQECARNGKAGGKWHFDLNQDQDWPWVVQAYHT